MTDDSSNARNDGGREARIAELAAKARQKANNAIRKSRKLIKNLKGDLETHGEPERWKRFGDLLLANVSTALRDGEVITVSDYFDDAAPLIEIEGAANLSLSEIAETYFRKYVKARNARSIIAGRIDLAERSIEGEMAKMERINAAEANGDENYLVSLSLPTQKLPQRQKKKKEQTFKGARRFASTDGFEILVGKKAKDNDFLTFRVAKSLDLWLHAADYPGSHVVIRSQGKKPVPDRTLLEAAQLAAFYSDAREHPKAAVRYTQKKFVNKPKRSVPGLVSLSKFKTILVEPQIVVEMIREEQV